MELTTEEALTHGFVSAVNMDINSLHALITTFAKKCPIESLTDDLFDHISTEHVRLQKKLSTFNLRTFSGIMHTTKQHYTLKEVEGIEHVMQPGAYKAMKEVIKTQDDNNGHHGIDMRYCDMRFTQKNGSFVPTFDLKPEEFTPERIMQMTNRGSRMGCPATAIIPEYTQLLNEHYKGIVLPAIRKKYGR
jgi:hypothetical protein